MNNNPDYQAGSRGESMQLGGDLTAWRQGHEDRANIHRADMERHKAYINSICTPSYTSTPTPINIVSGEPEDVSVFIKIAIIGPVAAISLCVIPVWAAIFLPSYFEERSFSERINDLVEKCLSSLPSRENDKNITYSYSSPSPIILNRLPKEKASLVPLAQSVSSAIQPPFPPAPPMPEAQEVNGYAQQAFDRYYGATGDHLRGKIDDYLRTGTTTYRSDSRNGVTMTFTDRDESHLVMQFNRGGLAYTTTILSSPEDGALCGTLTTSVKPAGTREEGTTYPPAILCNTP